MKIAIWLDADFSPRIGGNFSYYHKLVSSIDKYQFDSELEVCFATLPSIKVENLQREVVKLNNLPEHIVANIPFISKRIVRRFRLWCQNIFNESYKKQLTKHGVQLIYYIYQFPRPIKDFPFVTTHWDIAYKSTFAFPELTVSRFKQRTNYYENFLPKALMVFCESEAGKEELIKYTGLNPERIRIVPLFAGECADFNVDFSKQTDILNNYGLERNKYFFYPAQFWPEKNHIIIVKALSEIHKKYPEYKVVFTGNEPPSNIYGTSEYIREVISKLGLRESFVFPGFIPTEAMYVLYKNACAHIMASYVGPTNMPPLEAMKIGCPVICTSISGHKEQMKDAALYFDAKDVTSLVNAIEKMILDREKYLRFIEDLSKESFFTIDSALESINNNLLEASIIRSTWGK